MQEWYDLPQACDEPVDLSFSNYRFVLWLRLPLDSLEGSDLRSELIVVML